MKHEFGGDWTTDKLVRVRKYLLAYTTIFEKNQRARYYTTHYVDAFAGTGYRAKPHKISEDDLLLPEFREPDAEEFLKGSARIALDVSPSFKSYLFIESDVERAKELENLKSEFPEKASRIKVVLGDANEHLMQWCSRTNWRNNRAVVFLDPYGMQVDWSLIKALGQTKAIDLWILFPLGVAVNRLLTKSEPPSDEWAKVLTRFFGTEEWRAAFYPSQKVLTLFGEEERQAKQADFEAIGKFFVERLKSVFVGVAPKPLPLYNSRNNPLYLLCFASGNPTAIKIADHILRR